MWSSTFAPSLINWMKVQKTFTLDSVLALFLVLYFLLLFKPFLNKTLFLKVFKNQGLRNPYLVKDNSSCLIHCFNKLRTFMLVFIQKLLKRGVVCTVSFPGSSRNRRIGPWKRDYSSSSYHMAQLKDTSNNYLPVITFFILWKVHSVHAMRHIVLFHPLVSVLSPLGRDPDDLWRSAKVNLQPLVPIVVLRGPGPNIPSAATTVKTTEVGGMVNIPNRRCCDHVIFYAARLHSHWSVTECAYE